MNLPPPSEKQARVIWFAATGLAVAALVALLVALVWGLGKVLGILSPVLWPIAIAGVLAYLLDPVVDFLERKRVPRTRAIAGVFVMGLVIIAGLLGSVVPQVIIETRDLALKFPTYAERLQHSVEEWASHPPRLVRALLLRKPESEITTNQTSINHAEPAPISTNGPAVAPAEGGTRPFWEGLDEKTLKSATSWLADVLPGVGSWLFGQVTKVAAWFGVLVGLALVPVYAFYFLLEKRGISTHWKDYLPVADSRFKEELVFVLNAINDYLIAFFRGQVLVAMCDSVLYTIGFFLIGLPYSMLLGVMAMFLTIIPFIGAITICLSALILALVNYGDWLHPLLVLLVFGIVQAMEGLVISPKIMGNRVGLHPLAIIIALMVGTTLLGGILGGILAIPLAAALRVIMFRYVWKKREA